MTVKTHKMIYGGFCIAESGEGKKILVKGSLPDETVEIEITKSFKDYDEGKVVNVLEKNPHRVIPRCPKYGICGGCNLQIADDEYQVRLRKNILENCLERNGVSFPPEKIQCIADKNWNYRNRFQLHYGSLMAEESNDKVEFTECPVAVRGITKIALEDSVGKENLKKYSKLFVFCDEKGTLNARGIDGEDKSENEKKIIGNKKKNVRTGGKRNIYDGTNFDPSSIFETSINQHKIKFDIRGFFQSNIGMLEKTAELFENKIFGTNLLDFYSGVGTFSVILSKNFKHTTLVEHNRDALVYADMNLSGIDHELFGLSGEKFIKLYGSQKNNREFDCILIDPPRSGMEKPVLDWLCSQNFLRIVLVSCNPVTQSRDIALLQKHGWIIDELYLLDYYPQTSHIESVTFLSR